MSSLLLNNPLLNNLKLTINPFDSFRRWLSEAEVAMNGVEEAAAMTLATASASGIPSARIVLYKGIARDAGGREGFQLFTNFDSHKSQDLQVNPRAALVFFWPVLNRQIRIQGEVVRLSATDADKYFASRPRGSQIGAWASPQSQKIKSREELLERVKLIAQRFQSGEKSGQKDDQKDNQKNGDNNELEIPRPANWGGWLLIPDRIEFWQAGESRLHDRFLYERKEDETESAGKGIWEVSRLAP